jgi:hypothetical protein
VVVVVAMVVVIVMVRPALRVAHEALRSERQGWAMLTGLMKAG